MNRDETITIPDVRCVAEGRKAVRCVFPNGLEKWVARSLIVGEWCAGDRGALQIPRWLWRRFKGEELRKAAPQSEFEVDRIFTRLKVLCETRDKLDAGKIFDDYLAPLYRAMRAELHAAQEQVRIAYERIVALAATMPAPLKADLLAVADELMRIEVDPEVKSESADEAFG